MSPGPLSVGFISLGCPKNLVDSQVMAGVLLKSHMVLAPTPEDADVVIVNTCAFIDTARAESVEAIQAACDLKQNGTCRAVVVAGCLSQRYRESLRLELPDVDAFIGLDELDGIGAIVREVAAGGHGIVRVSSEARRLFEPEATFPVFSSGAHAYLKIAEGCNHACAFCAIPGIRGRHRSRPLEAIVKEAERLLGMGFRELDLISQDVTFYGRDASHGTGIPELLRALGAIGGAFWIRLLYAYPTHVSDAVLAAMGDVPQVCRYLDVPIQHSHPAILRAMRRADSVGPVADLAVRCRSRLPGVALRTTCLVGFPGETEECFQHLLDHVRSAAFDHLGVFTYSPEEGTAAHAMEGRPAPDVAEDRRARLMEAQRTIVDQKARGRIGTEDDILIEKPAGKAGAWLGRSRREAPEIDGGILVQRAPRDVAPGAFVRARFTRQDNYNMVAVACPT
jgi:ribosomal protein S12 methylthiotransferase